MKDLFFGLGIGHSILLVTFVVALGTFLGKFKVKGISIGATWILFMGILLSHFGFRIEPNLLAFIKDLGLILFVYSIGLQVGPGFFQSFKSGGLKMNSLAVFLVLMSGVVTILLYLFTSESLATLTGVMSGAVTNTPGLGAAQQTLSDILKSKGAGNIAESTSNLASAYAVSYPLGVLGVLFLLLFVKKIFKIDLKKEKKALDNEGGSTGFATRLSCVVENPAVFGKSIKEIVENYKGKFVVVKLMNDVGDIEYVGPNTVLRQGDKLLIVTSAKNVKEVVILFGKEIEMSCSGEWEKSSGKLSDRRLTVTKSSLTGKKLKDLNIRALYGVSVTRVIRAGVELVASPNLYLQMGDVIFVVGSTEGIDKVAQLVGNHTQALDHPNLIPIFLGIAVGVVFGTIPFKFPGIPQAIKLGLAGGPLIVAILVGYFGPKWKITTYTTNSANMMLREIGISLFLAAVGIGAGENFVNSLFAGGYKWILYGALITIIPVLTTALIARIFCKLNFYQICGLITGSTTNPPVLAFAQSAFGTDYTSINYVTVYPLAMFMRVLMAQILILLSFV